MTGKIQISRSHLLKVMNEGRGVEPRQIVLESLLILALRCLRYANLAFSENAFLK